MTLQVSRQHHGKMTCRVLRMKVTKAMLTQHQISIAKLDKSRSHDFVWNIDQKAIDEIIKNLDLRALEINHYSGVLNPAQGGWDLDAQLKCKVTQNCVISGAPVYTELDLMVKRKFRKNIDIADEDGALEDDFDDTLEALPSNIEHIDLINESISLAIPDFPKLKKYLAEEFWSISSHESDFEASEEETKPFAQLKKLISDKKNNDTSSE